MKEATHEEVGLRDWCFGIKKTIDDAVLDNWPRPWDENDITTSILRGLCTKHRRVLLKSLLGQHMFTVEWDAFKLKPPLETNRGDVAVLVQFQSGTSKLLKGVGFFESKRIYNDGRFVGIKGWKQLESMQQKVAHHHVVLYDHESCSWNQFRPGFAAWNYGPDHSVHCLAIPTNRITTLKKKDRTIYAHCTSFWELLCLRYIQGFDLEFEQSFVEEATQSIDSKGGPNFLLVANVAASDGEMMVNSPRLDDIRVSGNWMRIVDANEHDRDDYRRE